MILIFPQPTFHDFDLFLEPVKHVDLSGICRSSQTQGAIQKKYMAANPAQTYGIVVTKEPDLSTMVGQC